MTLPELRNELAAKPLVKLSCAEAVTLIDAVLAATCSHEILNSGGECTTCRVYVGWENRP